MEYHLTLPCSISDIEEINAGDIVYLSGLIVTGRNKFRSVDSRRSKYHRATDR